MLDLYFTEAEIKSFRRTGDLAERVAEQRIILEKYKKDSKKFARGQLEDVSPQGMYKFLKGDKGWKDEVAEYGVKDAVSKIKFVRNMTRNNKAAFERVQNDYRADIRSRIYDAETGRIKQKQFANILHKEKDIIVEMLGRKAFEDLKKVSRVLTLAARKPAQSSQSLSERSAIKALQVYAAPLSPRGRAFSAGILFTRKAQQKAIADAILDERKIGEIAKIAEHSKLTRQTLEKAYYLGLLSDEEE